jgi:uncharacterized protein (TIGR03435 family)
MRKITAVASNMSNLAESLTMSSMTQLSTTLGGLLVLNRTGLPDSDFFDFAYEFGADPDASQSLGVAQEPAGPTIFEALEKLGLTLSRTKDTREFVVVEKIDRPSPH